MNGCIWGRSCKMIHETYLTCKGLKLNNFLHRVCKLLFVKQESPPEAMVNPWFSNGYSLTIYEQLRLHD